MHFTVKSWIAESLAGGAFSAISSDFVPGFQGLERGEIADDSLGDFATLGRGERLGMRKGWRWPHPEQCGRV